jgi:uncharacterized membrane protein
MPAIQDLMEVVMQEIAITKEEEIRSLTAEEIEQRERRYERISKHMETLEKVEEEMEQEVKKREKRKQEAVKSVPPPVQGKGVVSNAPQKSPPSAPQQSVTLQQQKQISQSVRRFEPTVGFTFIGNRKIRFGGMSLRPKKKK